MSPSVPGPRGKRLLPARLRRFLLPVATDPYSYDSRQYYRLHVYSLIAVAICDVFVVIDRVAFPDVYRLFLIGRFGIVTPAAILVNVWLHRFRPNTREILVLMATCLASDSIFYPTSRTVSPLAPFYMFCGACMLLAFSNLLMRFRFWNAVACSTVICLDMSVRLSQSPTATHEVIFCSAFLSAMTALLTLLANFGMERDERGYLMSEQKRAIALGAGGRIFWEADFATRMITFEGQNLERTSCSIEAHYANMHPEDRAHHGECVQAYCDGLAPVFHCEYRVRAADGSWRWRETNGRTVEVDRAGRPARMVGTAVDITERKELHERLELARHAAEQAAKARSEFLANMSHEIRTPMNAVVGMTSLLLDQNLPVQAREYVNVIRSSSDSLLTIINDILDFSKIESGKLELEHTAFSLHESVEDAVELLSSKASEKGVELIVDIAPEISEHIYGDATRLRQIIVNLVGNAVKFTESGEVVVSVRLREGDTSRELDIAVRDTGIGIAPDRLHTLFQSFTQVDASTTRRFGGTGLGLAISRRLAELMGGRIWAQSEPGVGSTFEFVIPYEPAPGEEATPDAAWSAKRILVLESNGAARKRFVDLVSAWGIAVSAVSSDQEALLRLRHEHWDALFLRADVHNPHWAEVAQAAQTGAAPPSIVILSSNSSIQDACAEAGIAATAFLAKPMRRKQLYRTLRQMISGVSCETGSAATMDRDFARRIPLRILLAEDNPVNQKVAALLLDRLGYRPDVVANGLEVLDSIRRQVYDLILLDVQMPEMDGLEAARQIRSHSKRGERPWLTALTAGAMRGDRDEAMAAGMDDYLTKPINVAALQAALQRCHDALACSLPAMQS